MSDIIPYKHTNSLGRTYYLHKKEHIPLRIGKVVSDKLMTLYYFAKDIRPRHACALPEDREVRESPRSHLPVLRRKKKA